MPLLKAFINQAGYEREHAILADVSFTVKSGELVGMIGSNGAGKSTTIKALLNELAFIQGEILWREGSKYSYIPERPIFYEELTLWEHFEFVAAVEQLHNDHLERAKELLRLFRIYNRRNEFPITFSKGMQQKGMIALALFTRPDLLIIDEPFMGLDPASTKLLLTMIDLERQRGTGILMCTHVLDTAQRICDSFVIIEKGTMKASGTLQEVFQQCEAEDESLYSCISLEDEEID